MRSIFINAVVSTTLLVGLAAEQSTLPNIGQMQLGVTLFFMNAEEGVAEPGFTKNLFEFVYSAEDPCYSDGGMYGTLLPDAVCTGYQKLYSTTVSSKVDYAYNMNDYKLNLYAEGTFAQSVSIGGYSVDLLDVSVTASSEFKLSSEFMETHQGVLITSRAYVETYSAELSPYIAPNKLNMIKLNKELVMDIQSLPAQFEGNEQKYYDFITRWGTHYQRKIVMGAKYSIKTSFTLDQYYAMINEGIDVTVAAQESTAFGSTKNKEGGGNESASAQTYDQMGKGNQVTIARGPEPPTGNLNDWYAKASVSPAPLSYHLDPQVDFFTADWIDDKEIEVKAVNWVRAVGSYCAATGKCYVPTPPPVKLWEDEVTVSGGQSKKLTPANDTLCILSQVWRSTFEWCRLHIAANEVGDATSYWYIAASSANTMTCSAICSTPGSVSWVTNANGPTREYNLVKNYKEPGEFTLSLTSETADKAYCMVSKVQNHVGCGDRCGVSVTNNIYSLLLATGNPWDGKHQSLNAADRACGAICFGISTMPKLLLSESLLATTKSLILADDAVCVLTLIIGTGACDQRGYGGGCHLTMGEVQGKEGVWWTLHAITGTDPAYQCRGECAASCFAR